MLGLKPAGCVRVAAGVTSRALISLKRDVNSVLLFQFKGWWMDIKTSQKIFRNPNGGCIGFGLCHGDILPQDNLG